LAILLLGLDTTNVVVVVVVVVAATVCTIDQDNNVACNSNNILDEKIIFEINNTKPRLQNKVKIMLD
jgi:hypothetical protein